MADLLARLSNLLWPGHWVRKHSANRRRSANRRHIADELFPALHVRTLEERRAFHADAIAPPIAGATTQPPPPPPQPTTTVSIDANQNLLIQDANPAGQNNQ